MCPEAVAFNEVSHYKNGKKDGLWTEWDEDGRKTLEVEYKDGEEDKPQKVLATAQSFSPLLCGKKTRQSGL